MGDLRARFMGYASRPDADIGLFSAAALDVLFLSSGADSLQADMTLVNDRRAIRYTLIAAAGNVAGAVIAFMGGFLLFSLVVRPLMALYGVEGFYLFLKDVFSDYNILIVLAAGAATLPYRVVAVLSGFFGAPLPGFLVASALARGGRAAVISWLLWRGGVRFQPWLERYFHGVSTVLALGLLLFFVMLMLLLKTA